MLKSVPSVVRERGAPVEVPFRHSESLNASASATGLEERFSIFKGVPNTLHRISASQINHHQMPSRLESDATVRELLMSLFLLLPI